ncbi:MAG: flagellar export protein FliJ [Sulfurimonas sp.]|nr:flagellar export protein FliJ [Sulfurimonas sp.]MDQ7060384.1 flagellar export protein FliJ [Sulfurimonas sp.]
MKTRYSSLLTVKKSSMQKSERVLQGANADLNNASITLELSYNSLGDVDTPQSGAMSEMLASRTLLQSQRALIEHNKEWLTFTKKQVEVAKEKLKFDMIEYEKFNYLELEEIKKMLQEIKRKEAKDLDEVALMTHARKKENK